MRRCEQPEPFDRLLDDFPESRVHAFELHPAALARLASLALLCDCPDVCVGRNDDGGWGGPAAWGAS